jgi:hypothetical protein
VFFCVSVAVMPVLSPSVNASSMSLSSIVCTIHSTKWCTEPSLQVRPSLTRLLPCWCSFNSDIKLCLSENQMEPGQVLLPGGQ